MKNAKDVLTELRNNPLQGDIRCTAQQWEMFLDQIISASNNDAMINEKQEDFLVEFVFLQRADLLRNIASAARIATWINSCH